jgi:hypothetical protein
MEELISFINFTLVIIVAVIHDLTQPLIKGLKDNQITEDIMTGLY